MWKFSKKEHAFLLFILCCLKLDLIVVLIEKSFAWMRLRQGFDSGSKGEKGKHRHIK